MNDVEVDLEKISKILKKAIDLGGVCCYCYQEASEGLLEGLLKEVIFMEVWREMVAF